MRLTVYIYWGRAGTDIGNLNKRALMTRRMQWIHAMVPARIEPRHSVWQSSILPQNHARSQNSFQKRPYAGIMLVKCHLRLQCCPFDFIGITYLLLRYRCHVGSTWIVSTIYWCLCSTSQYYHRHKRYISAYSFWYWQLPMLLLASLHNWLHKAYAAVQHVCAYNTCTYI